eukprot:5305674-Amphidinium_carterae.1
MAGSSTSHTVPMDDQEPVASGSTIDPEFSSHVHHILTTGRVPERPITAVETNADGTVEYTMAPGPLPTGIDPITGRPNLLPRSALVYNEESESGMDNCSILYIHNRLERSTRYGSHYVEQLDITKHIPSCSCTITTSRHYSTDQ